MFRWLRPLMIRVVLSCIALVVVGSQLINTVRADASSGWLSQGSPQVTTVAQLPSNQSPGISNRDCRQQDYIQVDPSTGKETVTSDCLVQSPAGAMGMFGTPIIANGTTTGYQVNPNYPYIPQPIPNQGMTLALSSAPVIGSYLNFYTSISRHFTYNTQPITNKLLSYTVNAEPDFSLRDKTNVLLPTNALGTLSYSSNGSWMLVDTPGGSFIRVNMATFDVLPFAPSLNRVGDYSNYKGVTAISDDGHYAAIASFDFTYFRVYDLTTCTGTTNNNYSHPLDCQSRDYWPTIGSKLNGFKSIYRLRFINDDNLSMTATYNWQSGTSYDAAQFTVTAPGKTAHSLDYLALGDSYISGEGEFQYEAGTDTNINHCHQSPLSYPFIVGTSLFNQYNSVACSGAVTEDVASKSRDYKGQVEDGIKRDARVDEPIFSNFEVGKLAQWEFVKRYQPRVVTLSIGGNDIGFGKIVSKCVASNVAGLSCFNSYDERMELVQRIDAAYSKLRDTYKQILDADPGVQLYVIGYPQVITQGSCGLNVGLNANEIDMAQRLVQYLDATIGKAAASVGARYVDVENALAGHRLCEAGSANIAMNGITAGNDSLGVGKYKVLGAESYHPNVLGHQLLAQAILQQTGNFKQPMPAANSSIPTPTPADYEAQVLLGNYAYSGHKTADVFQYASGAASDIVYRSVGSNISIGSELAPKPPNSPQKPSAPSCSLLSTTS